MENPGMYGLQNHKRRLRRGKRKKEMHLSIKREADYAELQSQC